MAQTTATKFILELGCNHQGDINIAKQMIDAAVDLGVWGVKFQKRDIESIPDYQKLQPRDLSNSFGKTFYEHRQALEFSPAQIHELKEYAEDKKLMPIVSVFDMKSARQMIELDFPYIKLPSQFYSHYALNLLLFQEAFSTIVSTGMHTFNEVVNWQYFDKSTIILYCRSIYPHTEKELDMEYVRKLRDILRYSLLGYSSHDKAGDCIPLMVMLGAHYVERHFTLDKTMKGSDHATVSSDIPEIKKIIERVQEVEASLRFDNKNELHNASEIKMRRTYRGI